jgi:uncharacterized coiled-coil protein SlyX
MPSTLPIDIASFAIANASAGPDVARAFLLQGSLGANGPLIAAKLITDQIAALQAEIAAKSAIAESLSETIATQTAQISEQEAKIKALEERLSKSQVGVANAELFAALQPQVDTQRSASETELESKAQAEAKAASSTATDAAANTATKAKPKRKAKAKAGAKPEAEAEAKPEADAEAEAEAVVEARAAAISQSAPVLAEQTDEPHNPENDSEADPATATGDSKDAIKLSDQTEEKKQLDQTQSAPVQMEPTVASDQTSPFPTHPRRAGDGPARKSGRPPNRARK